MIRLRDAILDVFRRAGTGFSAAQQGEYLHGWLPAMAERPADPAPRDERASGHAAADAAPHPGPQAIAC